VILGKGPSIAQVDRQALEGCLVININDSERFFSGQLAVLHSPWAYQSVKANGFRSEFYISDLNFPDEVPHIQVPYFPDTFDGFEISIDRLEGETLFVTDVLLLSAIKIALEAARTLGRKFEVFMLGFDFGGEGPLPVTDFSGHDSGFKQVFFKIQQDYFLGIRSHFRDLDSEIRIFHVGNLSFSDMTTGQFNGRALIDAGELESVMAFDQKALYDRLMNRVDGGHVAVVAELTNNHIGDPRRLVRMVELAKEAGADLIKVQKRDVDLLYSAEELAREFVSPFGKTLGEYRRAVELDRPLIEILQKECARHEIPWFASVLDRPSFDFINQFNPPVIKLPSTISNHRNYIRDVATEFVGDVVISTGFTEGEYEDFVLGLFGKKHRIFLLQCTSSYPSPPEGCHIGVIRRYDELRRQLGPFLFPGYSSHDVGSLGCMLAVAAGARMIEKHVKLGDLSWVHFDGVALDLETGAFSTFVDDVRRSEMMCGERIKKIHDSEHHKYVPNPKHN